MYDTDTRRIIGMKDLPVWHQTVGKRKRARIDGLALADMFDTFEMMGVEMVVIEAVGGRPKQGASAAFVFGYGVGLIYMAALYSRIVLETVPPATWKKIMNIPGKAKGSDDDIINRADELFPQDRALFRGDRGGKKIDRAEAAMLAKFGGDHVWHTSVMSDVEFRLAYQKADTGA